MDTNNLFLKTLDTPTINDLMDAWTVHPVSLMTALKWLVNIRDSAEHDRLRRPTQDGAETPLGTSEEMPIIKEYQKYGIPDLPVDPVAGSTKILNLFIVGCGARANGYLQALLLDYKTGESPYRVVGIADPVHSARSRVIEMVRQAGHTNYIAEYNDWRDVASVACGGGLGNASRSLRRESGGFARAPHIDIALIMTLDRDHAEPAVEFMSKGCHVIVEKPLGVNPVEMDAMVDAMHRYNRIAAVCTVLEYTSHARKMKTMASQLGPVEDLLIREQVGWHHDAYAFATGPFSNTETTSPYSSAKTIHDMSMGLNLTDDAIVSMIYMP